ncbi:hypothetical protein FNV43_RR09508 [Rhamnella rubrinervis]|uniref:Uncharacterized protein n=1 Tax=Rhamnella rubrinervis TaxID=2594499 RepID=A0A8K0HAK4_9ROSA|nr:hypothetical protein FNV43_RR09508 [Rhamnella rubrinervis]
MESPPSLLLRRCGNRLFFSRSCHQPFFLLCHMGCCTYLLVKRCGTHQQPRWLLVRGRKDEAIATLKSIAPPSNDLNSLTMIMSFSSVACEQETWNVDFFSTIKVLVDKNWAFRRLLIVMVIGFGIGMVYYGMPLSLGNLAFSIYLSVTFNALSEVPASLVTFAMIDKMNRKTTVVVFTTVSGICSIASVLMTGSKEWIQMGLELVSFFCACTSFNVLLIFTVELFPTSVRNSAISMVRQALVFGGVFSPMLAATGRENGFMSYGVFGLVIGFCGLFVVFLPETRGTAISDTMDEEEYKTRGYSAM